MLECFMELYFVLKEFIETKLILIVIFRLVELVGKICI